MNVYDKAIAALQVGTYELYDSMGAFGEVAPGLGETVVQPQGQVYDQLPDSLINWQEYLCDMGLRQTPTSAEVMPSRIPLGAWMRIYTESSLIATNWLANAAAAGAVAGAVETLLPNLMPFGSELIASAYVIQAAATHLANYSDDVIRRQMNLG